MGVHFIESGWEGPADKVTLQQRREVVSRADTRGRMFQAEGQAGP